MSEDPLTHVWRWKKWLPERHGQLCRVLTRGKLNSCMIEFADGTRVITSRYAVRKTPGAGGVLSRPKDTAAGLLKI